MNYYIDSGGGAAFSGSTDSTTATVSGSTNATCAANKTFASATDVDATNNQVTVTTHGYSTGFACFLTTSSALPGGLTTTVLYFLRAIDANTLAFYLTSADAAADTNRVDITSNGTGTQTIVNCTIALGGAPNLSTLVGKGAHTRLTTTGTSHVITFDDAHGLSTGDTCYLLGTVPGGFGGGSGSTLYFINALSSTTIRLYHTMEQAVAGGASPISASASANNDLKVHRATQQTINLASSTVTSTKIFKLLYVDNTNKFVIVNVNVTGLGAGSNWAIGGAVTASGLQDVINVAGPLDVVTFNTDISANPLNLSIFRNNGNSLGYTKFIGKAGAKRVITNAGNGALWTSGTGTNLWFWWENLEMQSQGTGAIYNTGLFGAVHWFVDCNFTDAGTTGFAEGGTSPWAFHRCSFSGMSADVMIVSSNTVITQCYFHDNTGRHVVAGAIVLQIADSIFERGASANGAINLTSSTGTFVLMYHCTVYRNSASGLKFTNISNGHVFIGIGNLFKDNGDASSEFNIDWLGRPQSYTRDSAYDIQAGRGGVNFPTDFPIHSGDITDIDGGGGGFIDADNGTASLRNFGLNTTSPGYGLTYTFPGGANQITFNIGADQPDFATDTVLLNIANKRANYQ
jgi:hypothetical protein